MKIGHLGLAGAMISAGAFAAPNPSAIRGGEWELHLTNSITAQAPGAQRVCYRDDTPAYQALTNAMRECSQKNFSLSGNTAAIDAVCAMNGVRVEVRGTVTMIDENDYRAQSTIHIAGAPRIPGLPDDMNVAITARRLGPCQPDDRKL